MIEFRERLGKVFPEVATDAKEKLENFYERVLQENKIQNLTRILDPMAFIELQIQDSVELNRFLSTDLKKLMDLGSGGGFPGIPCAILNKDADWTLVESERNKANFLNKTVREMHIKNVKVFPGRGEVWLKDNSADFVVSKAVGSIEKLLRLIGNCSTWNNLVLFKGPSWKEEWETFQKKSGKPLKIEKHHEYQTAFSQKTRLIIWLSRTNVPRGTFE